MSEFVKRPRSVPTTAASTSVQLTPDTTGRNDLRGTSYDEGVERLSPRTSGNQTGPNFLTELFARIDGNKDQGISRQEVIAHLKRVGIGGGFLGLVHSNTADSFMEKLDTNKDGNVTWAEFQAVAAQVMPPDIFNDKGEVKPELVDEVYAAIDTDKNNKVTQKELKAYSRKNLPEDTDFPDTTADVAAKLGIDALDLNRDGSITRDELGKAVAAVADLKRGS